MFDLMLDAIGAEAGRSYPNEERLENMIGQYYRLRWGRVINQPTRQEQYRIQPNDDGLVLVGRVPIVRRLEINLTIELAIFLLPLGVGFVLFWLTLLDLMRLQLNLELPPLPAMYAQNEEAILGLALFVVGAMFWIVSLTTLIQVGQLAF